MFIYLNKIKGSRGFTLVELLIVVIILAVLSGIGIPTYITLTNRAKEAATEAEMKNIAKGLELYMTKNQNYPLTEDSISVLEGEEMSVVPEQDKWKNDYIYNSDGIVYELRSKGKDGTEGNSDDIVISNGIFTAHGAYSGGSVSGSTIPGLLASLGFNAGEGTIVGSGYYAGEVVGAGWTEGISGSALEFGDLEGELYSYATIPDNDNLDLTTQGTLMAWINMESIERFGGIIHKGHESDFSDEAYTLQFFDNKLTLGLNNGEGFLDSDYSFETDEWYHVVGSWDEGGMNLYVNGELVDSTTDTVVANSTDGDVQIGAQLKSKYNDYYRNFGFDGSIDEVGIYDRALTDEEINQIYDENQ